MLSLPPPRPPTAGICTEGTARVPWEGELSDKKWGEPQLQGIETTKAGESLKGALVWGQPSYVTDG